MMSFVCQKTQLSSITKNKMSLKRMKMKAIDASKIVN